MIGREKIASLSFPCINALAIANLPGVADTIIDFPIDKTSKERSWVDRRLQPGFSLASTKTTLSCSPFRSSTVQFRSIASWVCSKSVISFCDIIVIHPSMGVVYFYIHKVIASFTICYYIIPHNNQDRIAFLIRIALFDKEKTFCNANILYILFRSIQ